MRRAIILSLFCGILLGCGSSRFAVVSPAQTQAVESKRSLTITREPLTYELNTRERRLVVDAINHTDHTLTLLPEGSYVVTPEGVSLPLVGRVAPPNSRVKLVLPPLQQRYPPHTPRFNFGVGVGTRLGMNAPASTPVFLMQLDPTWTWRAGGEIRLGLLWRPENGEPFLHEFVIRKLD